MADASLRTHKFHDLSHLGMRLVVGVFFMVHSELKFSGGFGKFLSNIGLPPEMAVLIGLLELVGGFLLVLGVLSRIASALIAIDMLGAIVLVKKIKAFSGNQGVELELLAFRILISIMVLGPGKISVSHLVKKIPRALQ